MTDLDFADDIVLLSESIKDAQSLLLKLEEAAKSVGLRINYKKTKAMTLNLIDPETLKLSDGKVIEFVADFCYLGSYVRHSKKDPKCAKLRFGKPQASICIFGCLTSFQETSKFASSNQPLSPFSYMFQKHGP